MKNIRVYIVLLLVAAIAAGTAGCAVTVKAADLMKGVSPNGVAGKPADADFITGMADFSVDLFKESIKAKENSLISPLSVALALAMTANGADNETLRQMETLLGGIPIDVLNEYLYSYRSGLPSGEKSKLNIANSIWFLDDENRLRVEPDFLQRNADYYDASLFGAAFDAQTVKDINGWVKKNTDGMIDEMLEKIDHEVMYLISAVAFDAEWATIYTDVFVRKEIFTNIYGEKQDVDLMYSSESRYLEDGMATGFVKPYYGGQYSFAALLPNADVSIDAYIESLTGEGFVVMLENAQSAVVNAVTPKFGYEYEISMVDALTVLGIPNAFSGADFSKMGFSPEGGLYISEVLHKTFIKVDERGTKAGAATMVAVAPSSAPQRDEPKIVRLDRPFVYAIIDNAANLPIFIGTVLTV